MSGRHGVVQHANFFIIKTSKSGPVQLCLWINVLDHADHLEMFSLYSSCGTMNGSNLVFLHLPWTWEVEFVAAYTVARKSCCDYVYTAVFKLKIFSHLTILPQVTGGRMIANFHDPRVDSDIVTVSSEEAQVYCASYFAVYCRFLELERLKHPILLIVSSVKLWHVVGGLYIWEYFTTLDYEWKVIRRRLPYRWTIWIYSLSRFNALLSIILFFVTLNVTTPINCQVAVLMHILDYRFSINRSSHVLINVASIAIWSRNKVAVALAMTVWMISIGFHLYNLVLLRFAWITSEQACEPVGNHNSDLGFIPTIVADMALFLSFFPAWSHLARTWLRSGNSNSNQLHSVPSLIAMTIAATRMHRSLVDFACGSTEVMHESRPVSTLVFSKTKRTDPAPATLDQIQMSVNMASEQRSTDSKNDGDSSTVISTSDQIHKIAGDPQELAVTQASAHPLPTNSPSPVLEAESV
ncbi:hypothetical protein BGY98DRAFT_933272 [Russula aff. rugulosa BPL654]|nr:hypothetical protein BGY98DRAFT_933272 [Russula aff. rugulosa BPL654]